MKVYIFLVSIICFLFLQEGNCFSNEETCSVTIEQGSPDLSQQQDLVLLFIDFPDGRINGNVPEDDGDLDSVTNLDAVGSMGWDWINPDNHSLGRKKTARKYTYDDYWDMFFTQGTYIGANVHPDYESHGVEVYGSFRDYYNEVSYGNLDIVPFQTHSGGSGKYFTGIVNPIDTINGIKYVRWAMAESSKTFYSGDVSIQNLIDPILDELYNNEQTTFNKDNYTGKIMAIIAGGLFAGNRGYARQPGIYSLVIEKNYDSNIYPNVTLAGIHTAVHEFGHNLGFYHIPAGTFDPMNAAEPFTWVKTDYCPEHFNPLFKLKAGWIDTSDFTKIRDDYNSLELSPSHLNGNFATVTIYGDALRNNDYTHSEYFILEYRTRENFNRFSGGDEPTSFNGGVLVWHHDPYTMFYAGSYSGESPIGMKVQSPDNFIMFRGAPKHFFYSNYTPTHNVLNPTSSPVNSNSHENISTGISLENFSINGNGKILVDIDYQTPVPEYNHFHPGESLSSISNNVFIGSFFSPGDLIIADGTQIDIAPETNVIINSIVANASSQNGIIFQGAGFGESRVNWYGINLNSLSTTPSYLTNCLIRDADTGLKISTSDVGAAPVLSDIEFQNCSTDLWYYSFNNTSKSINATNIDYSTNAKIRVMGKWDLATTFIVPAGSEIIFTKVLYYDYELPTELRVANNASIINKGTLTVDGEEDFPITFTHIGASEIWGGIKFSVNGRGTINNAKIEYAKKGVYVYSTSDDITIKNSTIEHFTEQGVYVRNSDITVDDCTIKNPDGASHGIYLYDYCDPEIKNETEVNVPGGIGIYQEYGNGSVHGCTIKNCATGIKTNISGMEIYNNFINNNTYGIRLANWSPVNIHDNDIYNNDVGLYLEQSQPSVVKWNNFGLSIVLGYLYDPNNDEGILVNSLESGNSFLSGKRNNFIDGGLALDIKNLKSTTLNATSNAWDVINNVGPVSVNPVQPFNSNAGPGGSLGKLAEEYITEQISVVPDKFILEQNYPNPFNPSTTIKFHLPEDSYIHLVIYDILGHVVRSLVSDAPYPAGVHQVDWNGTNDTGMHLSSGVYFYSIKANPIKGGKVFNFSRKLVYMR